jgi:hypothetical protein
MLNARIVAAVYALLTAQIITAQPSSSSLSGTVTDYTGAPFANMPIRAVNEATGTDARTFSSEFGRYEIRDLPAGNYVVSLTPPCCSFVPYSNDSVMLSAGAAHNLDIQIEETLVALGDDPGMIAAALRGRQEIPDLPVPRTAEDRPDLSGVWLTGSDPFPAPVQALAWAETISQERIANSLRDHPHTRCLPAAPPIHGGAAPFISKYLQMPELLVILFEDVPGFRQVFLDGRDHPVNPNPSWMGYSIGRWEGDTLVVDTVGFNDRAWTDDIYPRSEMMHMEERYTRTEYGQMELQVTFDDPEVFAEPLVRNFQFDLAPQEELIEYVCENNKWARNTEE